jgi:hypothetical protein
MGNLSHHIVVDQCSGGKHLAMVLDGFQGSHFEILEVEEVCSDEEGFPGAGWASPVDV